MNKEIRDLENFIEYFSKLLNEEFAKGIPKEYKIYLISMLFAVQEDLNAKKMEAQGIAELTKILLDEDNGWEE